MDDVLPEHEMYFEEADRPATCQLCNRDEMELTRHHLIPRSRHAKTAQRKQFSRQEMRGRIAYLCVECHMQIHRTFSDKDLAQTLNSLEALRANPALEKFVRWVRKQH